MAKSNLSVICTLFEGDYHYGVGALVNSLCRHGYEGTIYAGYRGALPPWVAAGNRSGEVVEHRVTETVSLQFLPMPPGAHLTNIKPEFMLKLWTEHCPEAHQIFYFDPDICIKCRWSFFEEWANCGVALCEDVNSPFHRSHPIRQQWRRLAADNHLDVKQEVDIYVNGGFIGVSQPNRRFLEVWSCLQNIMETSLGGREKVNLGDRTFLFQKTDQDAMNMSLMFSDAPYSLLGKEGMDFAPGGYVMSHAAGGAKPWRKRFLQSALRGVAPSLADRCYLENTQEPVALYSERERRRRVREARLGAAVGRILRRN